MLRCALNHNTNSLSAFDSQKSMCYGRRTTESTKLRTIETTTLKTVHASLRNADKYRMRSQSAFKALYYKPHRLDNDPVYKFIITITYLPFHSRAETHPCNY